MTTKYCKDCRHWTEDMFPDPMAGGITGKCAVHNVNMENYHSCDSWES